MVKVEIPDKLDLRPHHVSAERGKLPRLYFYADPNMKDRGETYLEEFVRDIERCKDYEDWGGPIDVVGSTPKDRELFKERLRRFNFQMRDFPHSLKVRVRPTTKDPFCIASIYGKHCPEYKRRGCTLDIEERLARGVFEDIQTNSEDPAALVYSEELGAYFVDTTWGSLLSYWNRARLNGKI
ncbi:MAG TPA: hypothetical protein VF189_02605 [Patescibacteria group bacterium]